MAFFKEFSTILIVIKKKKKGYFLFRLLVISVIHLLTKINAPVYDYLLSLFFSCTVLW